MIRPLALVAALAAPPVAAQTVDEIARLDVLPGWRAASGAQMAGLRITLAPGWKTYWRAPGDAGIPPQIDLAGSQNVASARPVWPVPEVFDQNGMRSIGYAGSVVIPLEVTPSGPGPARLTGTLDIGVCEDICVPMQLGFDAPLPEDGARDPGIVAALVNQPLSGAEAGLRAATCVIRPSDMGLEVIVRLTLPSAGGEEVVVIEAADPDIWISEADVTRTGDMLEAASDLVHMTQNSFALDRSSLRFTVLGRDRAVDIRGCSAG